MRLEHSFSVPVPVDEAWKVLLDLPRVAPCMPGAALEEFDAAASTFTGTVRVKLGPVSLTYRGKGRFVETDEAAHRAVIEASGREARGSGTASATVTAGLVEAGGGTRVQVATELHITGRAAQFGRGMISDVSAKLIGQFADCLAETLGTPAAETETVGAAEAAPEPIDLLEVTGARTVIVKYGPYVLGAIVLAIVIWLVVRR
jgi:carbon monoxide dehydrogenase subunit G